MKSDLSKVQGLGFRGLGFRVWKRQEITGKISWYNFNAKCGGLGRCKAAGTCLGFRLYLPQHVEALYGVCGKRPWR